VLAAPLCVMTIAMPSHAQEPRGLTGQVFDPTGAALPGVTVTLDPGAAARTATTAPDGRYTFEAVAAGAHVIDIKVPAFTAFRGEVTLGAPGDWQQDISMALGTLTETIRVTSRRSDASAAPAGAAGPARVRVGGNVRAPRKLKDVKPIYPDAMRNAGRGAVVKLEASIGPDGKVARVRALNGFVHPDFAAAATTAVSQWEFSPTLLNGAPVIVEMTVTITFALE
jgi:TonB family protein